MPRVCVFDVNETLLDLGALDPHFERVFGNASARQAWFGQFLTSWLTAMVTGVYQEFGTIGGVASDSRQRHPEQAHDLHPRRSPVYRPQHPQPQVLRVAVHGDSVSSTQSFCKPL
jgi:hypothetical protein